MIIEGKIINYDNEFYGQVEINPETGLIKQTGKNLGKVDIKAGESELIFPGFIDLHVHAREDASAKQTYKENFHTASQAAINGGVVHIVDMPNNPIAPVDDEKYKEKQRLTESSLVDVTLYAGIGPGTKPLSVPVPYKVYMGPSVGDLFFKSQEQLEETIKHYKKQNVSFHCEDPEILEESKSAKTHEQSRPATAEIKATDFALYLIEKYKLKGKLCHYSTKEGLSKITQAKERGLSVTTEVTPHHLFFDNEMINKQNHKWLQMNPPLRNREDRLYLIEKLKEGAIDFIATDHAPHTKEEKLKGTSGVPHLDTYGAFATWLIKKHNFTPQDIARVCAYNPGQFINDFTEIKFGQIKEGYAGSIAVVDTNSPTIIKTENLKTKCGWSPFENTTFPGRVSYTIIKGRVYKH